MTIGVREVAAEIHTVMLAFLRSALAMVSVLPILYHHARPRPHGGGPGPLRFTAWKLHLLRGLAMVVALNGGFYAIWKLPLATASILFFLAPIFATLFAMLLLGERVGPRRWAAMLVGFFGAVLILRPGYAPLEFAMLSAVVSSMAFAAVLTIGRMASDADGSDAVFVSSTLIVGVATLPPALLYWDLPGSMATWVLLLVVVAASSVRTYADIRAYAMGDASFLAPFTYLRLITVGLAGYLMFGETIDGVTALGGTVIIASTLYIALREAQLKMRRRGPGAAP